MTPTAGPSLETYLETRLNLLTVAQDAALAAADLRYEQRFDAQSKAVAAAFLAQQTAMQTALIAAEKAVQAALAAADRAVSKAELAADKRFDALNELRQMLNDTLKNLVTRTESDGQYKGQTEKIEANAKRIDGLEGRLNVRDGETAGNRRTKDDSKSVLGVVVSLIGVTILVITFFLTRVAPAPAPQVIYVPSPPGTLLPTTPPTQPAR